MSDISTNTLPAAWQGLDRQFRYFQLLFVAIKAGIPAGLAGGPLFLSTLAVSLGLEQVRLRRVLQGLIWCGAVSVDAEERYALTDAGRLLRDEQPGSFAAGIRWQGEFFFRAWGHLDDYLLTGETPFVQANQGTPLFDWLTFHPDLAALFSAPMTAHSSRLAEAIARQPAFETAKTIVDVGGGEGQLLVGILQAYPEAQGIVFDLPVLEEAAVARLTQAGLSERCRLAGGDMFKALPPRAEVYLLKWILHDWDTKNATRILCRCAEAMHPRSRLLVIERLMPEKVDVNTTELVQADLNMLCQNGGMERTLHEYQNLFAVAGLRFTSATPLKDALDFFVLEAILAP